jgi:DNA-binding MarR family transcriptional regulator
MNEMETAAYLIETIPFLSRTLAGQVRQALGEGWFTLTHVRVLAHVRRTGGCSLGDLATRRGVSLPTMSKMVTSLVEKGLITREPDPSNRRAVIIHLTPAGDELYISTMGHLQRRLAHELRQMTGAQRTELVGYLEELAAVMLQWGEIRQHLHLPSDVESTETEEE